jgi:transposase
MESRTGARGQCENDGSCNQAARLDAKKKSVVASERDEAARSLWREQTRHLDREQFVIVDECGSNLALTPLYARAPKGQRAVGAVPRNYGKNTTLIASLSLQGMGETFILEGAADAGAFAIYVEQVLAPSLQAGQIVVMDNGSIHQGKRVRQAIEAQGCSLLFLPAYSPDLSPIEEAFSKLKAALRRMGARTQEALWEAIAQALQTITAQDALGWFTHCGYLALEEQVTFTEEQLFTAQAF